MTADKDQEFSAYIAARQPALLRTAYLLAGDRAGAEDLLQNAFAKLYLSWDRVRDREALDGYVRRIIGRQEGGRLHPARLGRRR